MNTFKKIVMMFICSMFVLVGMTGCMSPAFSPEAQGIVTGKLLYTAYARVAASKGETFRTKVEVLWGIVDSISSTEQLNTMYDQLNKQFTEILTDKGLSEGDAKLLASVANDVLTKVKTVVDDKFAYDSDGVQFLIGVREGVDSMIRASNTSKK